MGGRDTRYYDPGSRKPSKYLFPCTSLLRTNLPFVVFEVISISMNSDAIRSDCQSSESLKRGVSVISQDSRQLVVVVVFLLPRI